MKTPCSHGVFSLRKKGRILSEIPLDKARKEDTIEGYLAE